MIIRRLAIGDFGVFRDQVMNDIASGIVLIAGPNRAGKTTLMQALRYLGYKFPRSNIIPPANAEYEIEADLEVDNNSCYVLSRTGYGDPQLSVTQGKQLQLSDIYHVDDFSYRQLFTISLDELRRIPEGIDSKQTRDLQSVLLGAGMLDLMMIPSVKMTFDKQAEAIGGKHGNFGVRQFSAYHKNIEAAENLLKEARQEIDEYRQKQDELTALEEQVREKTGHLEQDNLRLQKLRFLKERYELFGEIKQLSVVLDNPENQAILESGAGEHLESARKLLQDYEKTVGEFDNQLRMFRQTIPDDDWAEIKQRLLEHKSSISDWNKRISGLEERVNTHTEALQENQRIISELQRRLQSINEEWSDDFSVLDVIQTDQINWSNLSESITRYQKTEQRCERKSEEVEKAKRELKSFEEDLEAQEIAPQGFKSSLIFLGSGLLIIVGILLGLFVNSTAGIIIGIFGAFLVAASMILTYMQRSKFRETFDRKQEDVNRKRSEVKQLQSDLEQSERDFNTIREELQSFRESMNLDEEIAPELLKDYFKEVQDLKRDYAEWNEKQSTLQKERTIIGEDLQSLKGVINSVITITDEPTSSVEQFEKYNSQLRTISNWLEIALNLQQTIEQKEETEQNITELIFSKNKQLEISDMKYDYREQLIQYINDGETLQRLTEVAREQDKNISILADAFTSKTAEAFLNEPGDDLNEVQMLDLLEGEFNQFVSKDTLKDEVSRQEKTVQLLEDEIDDLKQQITRLEQSLENLATSEKMEKAQQDIDEARSGLEPLAREYAVNRIAGFMLTKLRDKLLQRTKDELLTDASSWFKYLTSEEYSQIILPDNLENADFLAVAENGNQTLESEHLSRGTQEQLFLSVRMSRILDIEPPLPVILDDSLVNFDVQHRKKAAEMIKTLSDHNQVFVLTCHPEIVEYIADQNPEVQYWTISDRQIRAATFDSVIELLQ